jgi:hypothetical protein
MQHSRRAPQLIAGAHHGLQCNPLEMDGSGKVILKQSPIWEVGQAFLMTDQKWPYVLFSLRLTKIPEFTKKYLISKSQLIKELN